MATLEQFIVKLSRLQGKLDDSIKKGLQKGALRVEADAKTNCPVKTGNLRASLTSAVKGKEAAIGTNTNYAPYVELGTNKMKPQPYLYPALAANKDKIVKDIVEEIERGLRS